MNGVTRQIHWRNDISNDAALRCNNSKRILINSKLNESNFPDLTPQESTMLTRTNSVIEKHPDTGAAAVLDVDSLTVRYQTADGLFTAVDDVSFSVAPGERVALVGESGSGKTGTCLAIAGFLTHPSARIEVGDIRFGGVSVGNLPRTRLPKRVPGLAMVFQDASTSLDPVWTIGSQLTDVIRATQQVSRREAKELAVEWLDRVGLTDTNRILKSRPYELSGGMRQRAMIALALSGQPRLLIADEPTSALDATLSREVMQLLVSLTTRFDTGLVLVTHDIHLSQAFTDRTLVMYGGKIVEEGWSQTLERDAVHPYTQALLRSVPTLESADLDLLPTIPISSTGQHDPEGGCSFRPRCAMATEACLSQPERVQLTTSRSALCWNVPSEGAMARAVIQRGA
jgi:peptide/nickel transport system ATP-binding protein